MHYVYEVNAYVVDPVRVSVCLSARMIHLQNRWMDLDEIWYGCHAIAVYPTIILFNSL
jgi:hypothetical protein